ncbi:MAG: hypothetical protein WCQ45_00330, partial [bacterium]
MYRTCELGAVEVVQVAEHDDLASTRDRVSRKVGEDRGLRFALDGATAAVGIREEVGADDRDRRALEV